MGNYMVEEQTTLNGIKINNSKAEVAERIKRLTYSQDWTSYNLAKTNEKIIAEKLLLELLDTFEVKRPIRVGAKGASLKEKIYSMFVYNYSGYSSRKCISELKMAQERKVITKTPHFNSILNYFGDLETIELIKKLILITALPLKNVEKDFAVDSSGFSTCLFERWLNIRTQKVERKRHWKKCHVMIGVKSNIITSVKITEGTSNDCPELIPLAKETRGFFDIREISADKAYLSRANMEGIAGLGAIPYIPFKSNSTGNAKGSYIWSRMFDYFLKNNEQYMQSYHKRSNVETAFSMIKRNFGNNLRTKKDISQVNEILMKCLCHNLAVLVQESFELGLEIDLNFCAEVVLAQEQS